MVSSCEIFDEKATVIVVVMWLCTPPYTTDTVHKRSYSPFYLYLLVDDMDY